MLGGGRFLLPIALLLGALALLVPMRVRASDDDDEETRTRTAQTGRGWRLGVGLVLTGLAIVGLLLPRPRRQALGRSTRSQHAGGALGAARRARRCAPGSARRAR